MIKPKKNKILPRQFHEFNEFNEEDFFESFDGDENISVAM